MTHGQCEGMMQMMNMMGGSMMGMGGMMGWPMMVGMLLFWGLIVIGVVLLARLVWNKTGGGRGAAEEILDERFARGEISPEEYEVRHSVLRRHP